MKTLVNKKSLTGFVFGAFMLGLVFNPLAAQPAQAQTVSELQAQIQQLLAQIANMQAQITGINQPQGVSTTFTRDLTIGSRGVDVTSLQQFLINKGHSIPAGATGYFGPQTKIALAAYQATKGINPAVGYFGLITRSNINGLGGTSGTTPPTNNNGNNDNGNFLQGSAGSISEYRLTSGFNNEEVGENSEDVEVTGLDIKVDNSSDIRLTSVQLAFAKDTATNDRFSKYADEVSLWLNDKEVGRIDASSFTDNNNWTKTISLKGDNVIKRGTTGTLVVAISGARNIDSTLEGQSWTVDFMQIRFTDAQKASISENPNTGTRTFSFESFATASNVKLKISQGDGSINDSRVLNVHASNKTRNVDILSFNMKVEGNSDVELDSMPIEFTVTGAGHLDEMASAAHLYMDGTRVGTENIPTDEETVVFNDLDLTLHSGKTYEFVVKIDLLPVSGALDEGDTISATIGETETDSASFDAEDESGEDLSDANKTGNATGGPHTAYDSGIIVSFVSASQTNTNNDGADNDTGTFTVKYKIEAFDGTIYVSNSAAATTTDDITDSTVENNGVLYLIDKAGTATTDDLSAFVSWKKVKGNSTSASNGIRMNDGDIVEFTLSVARTNDGDVNDDGIYRMLLKAIGWNTDNSTTFNVYDFDLGDYKTDPIYLN